jgi:hypothetical protein
MKRAALAYTISILTILGLLAVTPAFATTSVDISNNGEGATSNVNVHTNTGQNTVCINGKCTTSGGTNGTSTVCINGRCTTSNEGTIDRHEDGANVHVDNSGNSSVNVSQNSQSTVNTDVSVNTSTNSTIHPKL